MKHPSQPSRCIRKVGSPYTKKEISCIVKTGDDMNTKIYLNQATHMVGMTLKDSNKLEENNMALHVCKEKTAVIENRKALAQSLDVELNDFVCANQTHSANFHEVKHEDAGKGACSLDDAIEDTDALYTYESNIVLCSFTADCVPVLFYHEDTGLIGAIHSGWQGTVKEITPKVLAYLMKEGNSPEGFHVYLGMALSQEKFEVDQDVYDKFHALGYAQEYIYYKADTDKYHIDNQLTVKKQCELAGISSDQISLDRNCTFKSQTGFSHREDKRAGRHVSFIMRK